MSRHLCWCQHQRLMMPYKSLYGLFHGRRPNLIFKFFPNPQFLIEPLALQDKVIRSCGLNPPCEMGEDPHGHQLHFNCGDTVAILVPSKSHFYNRDWQRWTLAICSQLHAISQVIKFKRTYSLLPFSVFYRLSLATQAPTLPVCTDNGGAVPTAVMLLLGYFWASYATKGGTQHWNTSKCGNITWKSAI